MGAQWPDTGATPLPLDSSDLSGMVATWEGSYTHHYTHQCCWPPWEQTGLWEKAAAPVGSVWLVAQSCPTLCDPMDCSPPGSSVHGILQARVLEWIAIPFSSGSSQPRDQNKSPTLQVDSSPSEPPVEAHVAPGPVLNPANFPWVLNSRFGQGGPGPRDRG